jgi:hypothetical protein
VPLGVSVLRKGAVRKGAPSRGVLRK